MKNIGEFYLIIFKKVVMGAEPVQIVCFFFFSGVKMA